MFLNVFQFVSEEFVKIKLKRGNTELHPSYYNLIIDPTIAVYAM